MVDAVVGAQEILIAGKSTQVDQVIRGAFCDAVLKGKVYVACDLSIVKWEENPLFLKDCEFEVEDGSVVYVAAHNDTAYYKGCSCHTGQEP